MPIKLTKRHGSPFWYLRGTVRGIIVDESTRVGLRDRRKAEEIRAKREAELLDQSIYGRAAVATFAAAALSYMESGGERRFLGPILRHFGEAMLGAVTQDRIDACAAKLYPNGSPGTLNRQVYAPVSAVLRHAADKGWCTRPIIKRRKEPSGRVRSLSHEEADRLVAACSPHIQPLITFYLATGARVSEGLYLDWSNVDLQRGTVLFPKTKNGKPRGVSLSPRVVAALANIPGRTGAVFRRPANWKDVQNGRCLSTQGRGGNPILLAYSPRDNAGGQIKTAFKGACRRAGIVDFHPHDCRHTWATWHYAENRDLFALKELGGWQSTGMVARYAHVASDHVARTNTSLTWGRQSEPGEITGTKCEHASEKVGKA